MNFSVLLVDEAGNVSPNLRIERGEVKQIYLYCRYPNSAPYTMPYNAANVEVNIAGEAATIKKDFSSGVAWLGAYTGVWFPLSAQETAALPVGPVDLSICVGGTGFKWLADLPKAFLVADPIVK